MAGTSFIVAYVAVIAAFVCWGVGIFFYIRTHAQLSPADSHLRGPLFFAWMFTFGKLSGDARESARKVNMAMIGFFFSLLTAIGAWYAALFFATTGR